MTLRKKTSIILHANDQDDTSSGDAQGADSDDSCPSSGWLIGALSFLKNCRTQIAGRIANKTRGHHSAIMKVQLVLPWGQLTTFRNIPNLSKLQPVGYGPEP